MVGDEVTSTPAGDCPLTPVVRTDVLHSVPSIVEGGTSPSSSHAPSLLVPVRHSHACPLRRRAKTVGALDGKREDPGTRVSPSGTQVVRHLHADCKRLYSSRCGRRVAHTGMGSTLGRSRGRGPGDWAHGYPSPVGCDTRSLSGSTRESPTPSLSSTSSRPGIRAGINVCSWKTGNVRS